jgi:hypothetical protein
MINNTDFFNGFDITLNSSDVTKLKPFGIDTAGTIMPLGSTVLAACVATVLIGGSTCASTDNSATVHLAMAAPVGTLLNPGTTGLLFTAIFSITGTTLPGGITIRYQNGCIVSSDGDLCVAFSNGTISTVPETTQNGGFDNSDTSMVYYATISTSTNNLGVSLQGAPTVTMPKVTYTATSQNGFNNTLVNPTPTLALGVIINGTGVRPTATLLPTSLDLTGVPRTTFNQTGSVTSAVQGGVYLVTVTATYSFTSLITGITSSLSAAYSLPYNVTDYTITPSPNPVTVQPATGQPVTITVAPIAGFNTLVKFGLTIPPATASAGVMAVYSSTTVSGGSGSTTLTVTTTTTTPAGTYSLTITSNSTLNGYTTAANKHTKLLTIKAGGFTISATAPSHAIGSYINSTVSITYLNAFTGTVSITNNTVPNLSCKAASPASFATNGTVTVSCRSDIIGTYSLLVIGTSGAVVRITTATFTFQTAFTISASTPSALKAGNAETSTVNVNYLNGFSGTILLTNNTIANLMCQPTTQSSFTATGTASVSCVSLVAGTYALTVNATSGPFIATTTITFTFLVQIHDVAVANPSVNPSGTINVGTKVDVTVILVNKGPADETITVVLLVSGGLTVGTPQGITIAGNHNQTVIFHWDTTGFGAKMYTLTVQVTLATGETNAESNNQILATDIGSSTLQSPAQTSAFDPTTIAIIGGVVAAAAVVGTILILRVRRKPSEETLPSAQ